MRLLRALGTTALLVLGVKGQDTDSINLEDMIERSVPMRTHTLSPPYVDSDLQNRWWDFGADTIINTNKHVRLTQDRPSQTGWLWSRMPLSVSNWQLEFEFMVNGKANNVYGDGFAVWITKDRAQVGPVFGSVDYFTGLGIFFDTYANSRHAYQWPRVTAMLGDGKTAYDNDHDNAEHEVAACSDQFRRRFIPTKARLTHIKGKAIELKLQTKTDGEWTKCFEIPDPALPEGAYIGFSALTGDVSDNHDIVRIDTHTLTLKPEFRQDSRPAVQAPLLADNTIGAQQTAVQRRGKGRPAARSKKAGGGGGIGGWFVFLLKLVAVGAFIAFAVAAYRTYNAQKKSKRHW